jgi:hypothetical protein
MSTTKKFLILGAGIGLFLMPLAVTHAQVVGQYGYYGNYSNQYENNYYPATSYGSYYPYSYPAPTCTLSLTTPTNTYGGSSEGTLSWTTNNATSVYLSTVGAVNTWGTMSVYMYPYETFTLTLTGPGGTSNCQNTYYPTQYSQYGNGYYNAVPTYYQQPVVYPSYPTNYVPPTYNYNNYDSYNPITYIRNWWHRMGW